MTIQEQMKKDLMQAMKDKDEEKKSALRVVMGEFGRGETKTLDDDAVVKILKKLVKSEMETLEKSGRAMESRYIEILESYLPKMASEDDIRQWIGQHIDFSNYKNKMQAMKDIMAHFGSCADGSRVKEILQRL
ncbi:MAG: hypothetical protein COX19_17135 [Desulfobacterales bacterium CG23_combo_of_CG06-09_8_20_14_all_51_8]|nr:MAG: hypothetical protein COX19_17135 [Desulfobacterales bacterium CG23_combo_of_CG06-09_8_20_14_all_51_8]